MKELNSVFPSAACNASVNVEGRGDGGGDCRGDGVGQGLVGEIFALGGVPAATAAAARARYV